MLNRTLTPSRLIPLVAVIALVALLAPGSPFEASVAHAQNAAVVARGIQTGTVTFGNGGGGQINGVTTTVTLGRTVDSTKAFVHCSFSTTRTGPDSHPTCELTNTTVVITLGATSAIGAASHTSVRWYVAEFEGNVLVQRGLASMTSGQTEPGAATVTLGTAVDCAKSFVLTTERMNSTTQTLDEQWLATATLVTSSGGSAPRTACTSGTTTALEIFRGETGTALSVAWQVVRIEGISVQRGTACISNGTPACALASGAVSGLTLGRSQGVDLTVSPLSAANVTKAFILTTARGGTAIAGQDGAYTVRADFSCDGSTESGNCLRFDRGTALNTNNAELRITWEVVSLQDTGRVERKNAYVATLFTTGTGGGSVTATSGTFTTVVQARGIPFFSRSNDRVNNNGDHANLFLAVRLNDTTLTFTRQATARSETIGWKVVEFFGCDTDPTLCHVSASALSGTTSNSATVTLAWWPSFYASNFQCFVAGTASSTPIQGPICNVLVVRTADGSTPSPTLANGTNITGAAGTLFGGGSCTRSGVTGGTASNPCIVFNQSSTGATSQTATDNFHSGGSGLANDGSTTYTYRVYVKGGTTGTCATWPCWVTLSTTLSQVSVTPKQYSAATGGMKWVYAASGGATLNSPIEDVGSATSARVFANSSNHKFLSIDTNTGSELSLPVTTVGAGLGYASWWPPNPPGTRASQVVIGDQKGYVTSFDGTTGARIWTRKIHTDASDPSGNADIDGAVSVQMRRFSDAAFETAYPLVGGEETYDVVFAATKNATSGGFNQNNKIYALKSTDGTLLWTFDPNSTSVCNPAKPMDVITTQVVVDYEGNRLLVTTEDGFSTAQNSLWIISSLGPTGSGGSADCNGMLVASIGSLRDIATTLWQNYDGSSFYFQNSDCALYARDTATGATGISDSTVVSSNTTDAAPGCLIKNSVWQDYNKYLEGSTRLYFVTQNGGIWCVDEVVGVDFDLCTDWPTNPVYIHSGPTLNGNSSGATPLGAPMLLEPHFWVGGQAGGTGNFGRGVLFQISTVDGSLEKTFTVDSSTSLGDLSTSTTADALYMGSTAGRLYRINLDGVYGSLP